MDFDRTKNAKRTIISGLAMKLLTIIVPFIMRTVIIYTLGNLYLGLGSLFSSILNTLSLAELGIGSAMVFSMYQPVAENDYPKICALLNVYKKIYFIIGIVISVIGIVLLPFLPKLIKDEYPTDINIYVLYVMQLVSTVSGYYFFAYKGSVLTAYQRVDITNLITFIADMIMYIFQIVSLLLFKNYYVYVVLILIKSVLFNIVVAIVVKHKYPHLIAKGSIDKETQKQITKKTFALTGHKIAEVVINSTDNIFISAFIGLNVLAIYNNYYYVITAVSGVILMIFTGMISIVGNYLISEDKSNVRKLFGTLSHINAFCLVICCSCLINMFQPFIELWTGKNNLFPMYMVVLFALFFYSLRIRTIMNLFQNAAGIWEKDLIKAYVMTIINLIVDFVLIQIIGIGATLISTIVSMIFAFIYEVIVVHKYILDIKTIRCFLLNVVYFLCAVLSCVISYYFMTLFSGYNLWIRLVTGGIVSIIVSAICFVGMTFWSREFKDSVIFVKSKIKR